MLARVGLAGKERTPCKRLSYGERRALEIGVALAAQPRLLFLDEPTAGLGAEGTARLSDLIGELKRQLTIVIIEHDMRFLFRLADRISVIHWGQVIAEGTPDALRDNPWVQRSNLGALRGMSAVLPARRASRGRSCPSTASTPSTARRRCCSACRCGGAGRSAGAARARTAPARRRRCARSSA